MPRTRSALGETAATLLAIALTIASAWLLAPEPGAVVLGGMLALALSRSQLERDAKGRLEAGIGIPLVGLVGAGIGLLLLEARWVGALVYVLALAASVWVRRFGPTWRRIGAIVAIPFTAILIAPVAIAHAGPLAAVGWLVPILVPVIAFVWVTLVQLGARAARLIPPAKPEAPRPEPRRDAKGRRPSDKMAVQLGIALAAAFVVGFLAFPGHWAWLVLTVVIVLFGNRGRVDALLKGIGRLAGSLAGTAIAFGATTLATATGVVGELVVAVVALAIGIFLRRYAYVWWALCFTVVLAIVQEWSGGLGRTVSVSDALGLRLLAILVGAAIAVAVSWWVLPVAIRTPLPRGLRAWATALSEP